MLTAAVARVAHHELGLEATAQALLGYIEYPSHLEAGLDWPVGMAFRTELAARSTGQPLARPEVMGWFSRLPDEMHDEQKAFLRAHAWPPERHGPLPRPHIAPAGRPGL